MHVTGRPSLLNHRCKASRAFVLQTYIPDEVTQIYDKIGHEIESHLSMAMAQAATASTPQVATLQSLLEAVRVARSSKELSVANALLQKVRGVQARYTG